MPEEALGQTTARVAVLPARVAYLIAAGSRTGYRRAVQEASTRWAGMTELIVPVTSRGDIAPAWTQMIETGQIDCMVNVDVSDAAAHRAGALLRLQVVPLRMIDRSGPSRWSIHPVNVAAEADTQNTVIMATSEEAALWEIAAAGDLAPECSLDLAGHEFASRAKTADQIGWAQLSNSTLLARGLHQFGEYQAQSVSLPSPAIVWVTTPNSLKDCIWFWNCRALGSLTFDPPSMHLVPYHDLHQWIGFGDKLLSTLARTVDIQPDAIVWSLSVDNDRLAGIADSLGLRASSKKPYTRSVFPDPPVRTPPYTYRLNIDPRNFVLFGGSYGRSYGRTAETVLQTGTARTMLTVDSPVRFTGEGYVLLRISSPAFDHLPRRPGIAALVLQDADWAGPDLQVRTRASVHYRLELSIPRIEEAVWALLHEADSEASLSDKGRLADRLAKWSPLGTVLEPGVLETIGQLTTPRSKELQREFTRLRKDGHADAYLADLAATWGGRAQRRYRAAADLRSCVGQHASSAVEVLADQGWAERGLEIKCDQCSIQSFVPLGDVRAPARCPACHAEQRYKRSPDLRICYRLNGLVDRAGDQGVLPHLMAVAALHAQSPSTHILMGVDVAWPDGKRAEVDLFGIHAGKVVAGEAKTSSSEFDIAQLRRDVEMSAKLLADRHLLVSLDAIPDTTVEQARKMTADSGMELVVVEGGSVKVIT